MSWMPSDDPVLGEPKTCCGEKTDVQAKQSAYCDRAAGSRTSPMGVVPCNVTIARFNRARWV
jgi:hypothetical protein